MNYWLMKSEPDTFSIDDLLQKPKQTEPWEGVRNYQARNFMRAMKLGDQAFFYHSSCATPGIMGTVEIVKEAHPDTSAFNLHSDYYDPKSTPQNPRWFMVSVKLLEKFSEIIPLSLLKNQSQLKNMILLKRGNRLSVMPVSRQEWEWIQKLRNS